MSTEHQEVKGGANTADLAPGKLFSLKGKVAVVTGGSTGIGLMISQAFAAAGAKVYIVSRRLDSLEQAAKQHSLPGASAGGEGSLIPLQVDITRKEDLARLVADLEKKESKIDLLVNNSGISGPRSNVEKGHESAEALKEQWWAEDAAEWDDVWRVNVSGHFFTTTAFLPLLAKASKAAEGSHWSAGVINIASISGITRTSQHHVAYNVSKAASVHLTRLLAQECSRPGVNVRVNAICPGIFPSEMTTHGASDRTARKSDIPEQHEDDYGEKKGIPANRAGADEEMAQTALMLAVNGYMTGEDVTVDGGYLLING